MQNPRKYLHKQIPRLYKQLHLLRLADLKYQSLPPFKDEDKAYNLLAYLYIGYVYVVNQFITSVNHTISYDEKQDLKAIIEKTVARILEIKAEMFALYKTDYPQIDHILLKTRVTRREVDLKVPYYFKIERKQLLGNFYTFANKIEAGEIGEDPPKDRPIPELYFNMKDYLRADRALEEIEDDEFKANAGVNYSDLLENLKEIVHDNEALGEYAVDNEEEGEDASSDSQFSLILEDEGELLDDGEKPLKVDVSGEKPSQKLPFDVVLSSSSSSPGSLSSVGMKAIGGIEGGADASNESLSMEDLDRRRVEDLSSDDLSDYLNAGGNVNLEDKKIFAETYCDKLPEGMTPEEYFAAQSGQEKSEAMEDVKFDVEEDKEDDEEQGSKANETETVAEVASTPEVEESEEANAEETADTEKIAVESESELVSDAADVTEAQSGDDEGESTDEEDDESDDSPKERRVRFKLETIGAAQFFPGFQGRPLCPPREFQDPKELSERSERRDNGSSEDDEECVTEESLLSTESDGSLVNLIQSMEGHMRGTRKYQKKVYGTLPSSDSDASSEEPSVKGKPHGKKKGATKKGKEPPQTPVSQPQIAVSHPQTPVSHPQTPVTPQRRTKETRDRRLIKAPHESDASSDASQFDVRHSPDSVRNELVNSFFYLVDVDYNKDSLDPNGRALLSLLRTIYLKRKAILGALGAQYKLPLLSLYGSHKFKPARDIIKMVKFKPELASDAQYLKTDVALYSKNLNFPKGPPELYGVPRLGLVKSFLERELKKLRGDLTNLAEKASREFIPEVPNADFVDRIMTKLEAQMLSLLPSLKRAHNSDKAYLELKNDIVEYLGSNLDDLLLGAPVTPKFENRLRKLSDDIAAGLRRIRGAFLHGYYKPTPRTEKKFCFEEKMAKTEYRLLNERIFEEINALEDLINFDLKRRMELKEIEVLDEVLEFMRNWHQMSKSQTTGWDLLPIPQLDHFKNRPPERLVGIPTGVEREFRDRRFPKMIIQEPLKITEQVLTGTAIITEGNLVPADELFYAKEWLFVKFLWLSMLDDKQKEAEAKKTQDALDRLRKDRDKALQEAEKKKEKQKQEGHLPWRSDLPDHLCYDVEELLKKNKPLHEWQFVHTDDLEHEIFMKYYSQMKRQLDGLFVEYQQRVRLEMIKNHGPTFELEPEVSELGDLFEKAEKPKKKEKPDLPPEVKFGLIYKLAQDGYFRRHSFVSMDSLIGEYSFSAYEFTKKYFVEGDPGWKDLYQVIKESCVFPLASPIVRARAPLVRSVLLLGPSRITRSIVNAMATDSGALMIYVDPLKSGRKLGKKQAKDAITKVAKMAGPTVIFFEGIHNANLKRKKKFGKGVNPKFVSKLIPDLAGKIDAGTQALVVATADEPWNTRGVKWTKPFDKVFPVPDMDTRTSEKFWQKRLLPRDYTNRYEIYQPLARKTKVKQLIIPASEAIKAVEKTRQTDLDDAILFKHLAEPILKEPALKSYWKWASQKVNKCKERKKKLKAILGDKEKSKGRF